MSKLDDAILLLHHRNHLNGGLNNTYDIEIEQALQYAKDLEAKYEVLAKDITRFLEVIPKPVYRPLHGEAYDLYEKLSKVIK